MQEGKVNWLQLLGDLTTGAKAPVSIIRIFTVPYLSLYLFLRETFFLNLISILKSTFSTLVLIIN